MGNCCGDLYALEEALGCDTYDGAIRTVRAMQEDLDEFADEVEALTQERDAARAINDAVVLDGIEAFVLMVSVIADQTVTRSFEQIAEDELVKLRERVARSART